MGYTSPEEQAIDNTKSGLLEKFRNVLETLESIQTDLNIVSKGNYINTCQKCTYTKSIQK